MFQFLFQYEKRKIFANLRHCHGGAGADWKTAISRYCRNQSLVSLNTGPSRGLREEQAWGSGWQNWKQDCDKSDILGSHELPNTENVSTYNILRNLHHMTGMMGLWSKFWSYSQWKAWYKIIHSSANMVMRYTVIMHNQSWQNYRPKKCQKNTFQSFSHDIWESAKFLGDLKDFYTWKFSLS
jgi:hypothetical protein